MNAILLLGIATMAGLVLIDVGCYFGLRHIASKRLLNGRRSHP